MSSNTPDTPREKQPGDWDSGQPAQPSDWSANPPAGQPYAYGPPGQPAGYGDTAAYGQSAYSQPGYAAQGYGQQPYGQGQQAPSPYAGSAAHHQPDQQPGVTPSPGGFFRALFDMSFSRYVTVSFARVIYVVAVVCAALFWLLMVIRGFASDEPGIGAAFLILGWIPALVWLIFVRVGIEFAVAMVKTADNTSTLANRQG